MALAVREKCAMNKVKKGDTVKVHYTGSLVNGQVFDSSQGKEPLEFTVGAGEVIGGFENAVIGMGVGESKTEHIQSQNAYGPRREELQLEVERSKLPPSLELEVGQMLGIESQAGEVTRVTVAGVNDQSVTLDANHPLSGKDLKFDIQVVEILAA
jgi:FKBP-type peptidyl-prolyl cis-trans isomerase 2